MYLLSFWLRVNKSTEGSNREKVWIMASTETKGIYPDSHFSDNKDGEAGRRRCRMLPILQERQLRPGLEGISIV